MNDGGPAYPQIVTEYDEDAHKYTGNVHSIGGMSLRDYAAIKFSAAWTIALSGRDGREGYSDRCAAYEAVRLGLIQADALLAERAKGADDETSAGDCGDGVQRTESDPRWIRR